MDSVGDFLCSVIYALMVYIFMPALVLALLVGAGCGVFYAGKWAVGLGHDSHGKDYARIVAKAYTPDSQQTSTVPVATGRGVGVGVVTTGNPEAWNTMLLLRGTVYSFNNRTLWAMGAIGDTVVVHYKTNPQWPIALETVDFVPAGAH